MPPRPLFCAFVEGWWWVGRFVVEDAERVPISDVSLMLTWQRHLGTVHSQIFLQDLFPNTHIVHTLLLESQSFAPRLRHVMRVSIRGPVTKTVRCRSRAASQECTRAFTREYNALLLQNVAQSVSAILTSCSDVTNVLHFAQILMMLTPFMFIAVHSTA